MASADASEPDIKEHITHARLVHFSLLAACLATLVAILPSGSDSLAKAMDEIEVIKRLVYKIPGEWNREYYVASNQPNCPQQHHDFNIISFDQKFNGLKIPAFGDCEIHAISIQKPILEGDTKDRVWDLMELGAGPSYFKNKAAILSDLTINEFKQFWDALHSAGKPIKLEGFSRGIAFPKSEINTVNANGRVAFARIGGAFENNSLVFRFVGGKDDGADFIGPVFTKFSKSTSLEHFSPSATDFRKTTTCKSGYKNSEDVFNDFSIELLLGSQKFLECSATIYGNETTSSNSHEQHSILLGIQGTPALQKTLMQYFISHAQFTGKVSSFSSMFPGLTNQPEELLDIKVNKAKALLRSMYVQNGGTFEALGVKVPANVAREGSAFVIVAIQLYLLMHLLPIRNLAQDGKIRLHQTAWIALYKGKLAGIVSAVTMAAAPVGILLALLDSTVKWSSADSQKTLAELFLVNIFASITIAIVLLDIRITLLKNAYLES